MLYVYESPYGARIECDGTTASVTYTKTDPGPALVAWRAPEQLAPVIPNGKESPLELYTKAIENVALAMVLNLGQCPDRAALVACLKTGREWLQASSSGQLLGTRVYLLTPEDPVADSCVVNEGGLADMGPQDGPGLGWWGDAQALAAVGDKCTVQDERGEAVLMTRIA